MTTLTTPAQVRRRSRLSRLRAGLLAFCLPLLSLAVVFTTPTNAQAFTTPTPVTISGALKSPPVRLFSMTPYGRGITLALGLGLTAWETKDKWFPTVKEWMNPQEPTTYDADGWSTSNQHCAGGVPEIQMQPPNAAGLFLSTRCGAQNLVGGQRPSWSARATSSCRDTKTGAITHGVEVMGTPIPIGPPMAYQSGYAQWKHDLVMPFNGLCTAAGPDFVPLAIQFVTTAAAMNKVPTVFIGGLNGGIPDADYSQIAEMKCRTSTGSILTYTDRIWGRPDRVYVPSCTEDYPGTIPWGGSIKGGMAGAEQDLIKFDINQTLFNQWKDCFGPGGLLCKTEVYVDGQRCIVGSSACIIWWDSWKSGEANVTCRFGPYDVPVTDCANLRYAYKGSHTITKTTTASPDLDPDAPPKGSVEINPNPEPQPQPQPTPNPNPNPNPNPTPGPTTGPNPTGTPETTPEANPDSRSCYGDAWSWNPVDWVYVPVKCALKWAFVPKTALSVRVNTIKTSFDGKFPFAFPAMISGMGSGAGGGCPDWRVIVDGSGGSATDTNVVCDSNFTAAIVGARPFLLAGMLAVAFWPLVRGLFFASVPVIKPTPTGRD